MNTLRILTAITNNIQETQNTAMSNSAIQWKSNGKYLTHNGYSVFYLEQGQGSCLLIFHGYPYNSFDFKDVWQVLADRFYVIAPDMLGMGFSDKPSDYNYSFEDHADMYTALLEQKLVKEVHIVAHDLGNSVVQELIARDQEGRNPFTIKSIAFLNGGLFMDVYKPRLLQTLLSQSPKPIGKLLSRLMSKKSVSKATAEVFGATTKPNEELMQSFWYILNYNNGKSIAYLIGRLVFDKDNYQDRWIAAMQQTKIPMCFINGPSDPNSGIHMANRYKELIPNPDVMLLDEHIGHWPQLEAPEQVITLYFSFISKYAKV